MRRYDANTFVIRGEWETTRDCVACPVNYKAFVRRMTTGVFFPPWMKRMQVWVIMLHYEKKNNETEERY